MIKQKKFFQNHKHSKYITIMLIPQASTNKVKSLKIGHWEAYFSIIISCTIIISLILCGFRILTFDNTISNIKTELRSKEAINSKLISEKKVIENSFDSEKANYQAELEALEKKSQEIEDKLNQLEKIKEDIYNKISSTGAPVTKHSANSIETALGGPIIHLANTTSDSARITSKMDSLLYSLDIKTEEFVELSEQVDNYLPYIEAYPSILPVKGTITSYVGYRSNPFNYKSTEYHTGLDIKVNSGTDVFATAAGTVIFSGYQAGYGYLVIIDHGYGIETRYGHNSSLLVKVGDKVTRGDIISKSGNSGRSTGPHVHYEIRLYNEIKNPIDYVGEEYLNVWKSK